MGELVRLQAEQPEMLDAKLKKVFAGIDKDHSGFLDFDEFKVAAKKFDLNEGDDVQVAFDRVDVDDSGTLDYDEFKAAIIAAISDKHKIAGVRGKVKKLIRVGGELILHYEDEE